MTKTFDRAAWLEVRRSSIGASEAAAVCGVSEWDTPLDIYLRKTGLAPEKPESEAMSWGTRLEPVIADAYAERTGCEWIGEQQFLRCVTFPYLTATLDRVRHDGRIVELKTIGARGAAVLGDQLGDDGSDVVPLSWRLQVTHQMVVSGRAQHAVADIAALIGGQELRVYTVPFDAKVADRMIDLETEFWGRVERRDPPPIDPDRDGQSLKALYPDAAGEVQLDGFVGSCVVEWEAAKEAAKEAEKVAARYKAQIMDAMRNAATGSLPDGRIVTRKIVNRAAYACPASSYVDLRIKTPKETR